MTKRIPTTIVVLLVSVAFSSATPMSRQGTKATEHDNPLLEHMDFLVRDGGKWRTEAEPAPAGRDAYRFYGLEYEWGPYQRHVLGKITGIMDDGRTVPLWHVYSVWNPASEQIDFWQIARDGTHVIGTITTIDDANHQAEMRVIQPSGEDEAVRHDVVLTGRDQHQTITFTRNDNGDWERDRARTWTRVKSP